MPIQLNHTIVRVRDKRESATFLAELLGVAPPMPYGPFLVVQVDNDVSLDFADDHGPVHPQHYAFLVGEEEFDQIFGRIRERGLTWWADPGRRGRVGSGGLGGRGGGGSRAVADRAGEQQAGAADLGVVAQAPAAVVPAGQALTLQAAGGQGGVLAGDGQGRPVLGRAAGAAEAQHPLVDAADGHPVAARVGLGLDHDRAVGEDAGIVALLDRADLGGEPVGPVVVGRRSIRFGGLASFDELLFHVAIVRLTWDNGLSELASLVRSWGRDMLWPSNPREVRRCGSPSAPSSPSAMPRGRPGGSAATGSTPSTSCWPSSVTRGAWPPPPSASTGSRSRHSAAGSRRRSAG